MEKIILFGASQSGRAAFMLLKADYDIICFSDNNPKKWGMFFCDREIICPNDLGKYIKDGAKIVIASVYYNQINEQLIEIGIEDNKLFYYLANSTDRAYNGKYILVDLKNQNMFENCIYNQNKIKEIENNFAKNYLQSDSESYEVSRKIKDVKRVLFCSYIFPPLGGSGTQRSLKFVKYLRKFGWEPIVLTVGSNNGKIGEDKTLLEEIDEDITIIRIDDTTYIPELMTQDQQQEVYNLYASIVQSKEWMYKYRKIFDDGKSWRLIPDNNICWVNECLKTIEKIIDFSQIDMIYTTGNPFSVFMIGWFLKKKYGIPWVQDYRDPWMSNQFYIENYYNDEKDTIELQKELERKLIEYSDAIVTVSNGCVEDFMNEYSIDEKKVYCITNGYDEEDFNHIEKTKKKNNKFTLCYNGTIYIDRNPVKLLTMINELISEGIISKEKISVVFNGSITERWISEIAENDLYGIVVFNGIIDHKKSIEIASASDLLVLYGAMGDGAKIALTGKVFEYLRMKKEILCFSKRNGALEKLLKETESGHNFENITDELKEYFVDKYKRWSDNELVEVGNTNILEYSRERLTQKLADIFDEIWRNKYDNAHSRE